MSSLTGKNFLICTLIWLTIACTSHAQAMSGKITLAAVGDILLDRGVKQKIEKNGIGFPFEKVKPLIESADLAFGNLENPISAECSKSDKKYSFRAEPKHASILKDAGFDVLSLANNHILDCGMTGLRNTISSLSELSIETVGAGVAEDLNQPLIIDIKGVKIGIVAFTTIAPVKSGVLFSGVSMAEAEHMKRAIEELKQSSDVVIVSFHWGTEYSLSVNSDQSELADIAVGAGADVVLGHHPHVTQGIELVDRGAGKRKAIVAYSLGNFLFDSPVRLNRHVGESFVLRLRVDKDGLTAADVVPVSIVDYRPVPADEMASKSILERLTNSSSNFGTLFDGDRIVFE